MLPEDTPLANNTETARLKARIAELEAQLQAQERQQNLMIRSLFHDLKNPLAVTLGSLQVAKLVSGNNLPAKALRLLNSAEDGGKDQLAIINNFTDQIKIEMGELTIAKDEFEPGLIVRKKFDRFAEMDINKKYSYIDNAPGISIDGDSQFFERMIDNILENCSRHTRKGCQITGESTSDEIRNLWTLTITDNGESLIEDQFDSIFDRRRLAVSKNLGGRRDIGMGLAFARTAVRAQGGELCAVENCGVGAKFVLSLKCNTFSAEDSE